jgi:hypothetical protein
MAASAAAREGTDTTPPIGERHDTHIICCGRAVHGVSRDRARANPWRRHAVKVSRDDRRIARDGRCRGREEGRANTSASRIRADARSISGTI